MTQRCKKCSSDMTTSKYPCRCQCRDCRESGYHFHAACSNVKCREFMREVVVRVPTRKSK